MRATPGSYPGGTDSAALCECAGRIRRDGAECGTASAHPMAGDSSAGHPDLADVYAGAYRAARGLGLAISAGCASSARHGSVGPPLWPRDGVGRSRMGERRHGVVSRRLDAASGVSHLCLGGHDRWGGRLALRPDACVLELCVPHDGARHPPLACPGRQTDYHDGRDGNALYASQHLHGVQAAWHHSLVGASAL